MNAEPNKTSTPDENEIARVAGHGRDVDGSAPKHVHAEQGVPLAEHGAYGMVREGSRDAQGLSEEQICGVEPKPADLPEQSPALPPQPGHIDNPQQPLPSNPPVMPQPTPPETKRHPGFSALWDLRGRGCAGLVRLAAVCASARQSCLGMARTSGLAGPWPHVVVVEIPVSQRTVDIYTIDPVAVLHMAHISHHLLQLKRRDGMGLRKAMAMAMFGLVGAAASASTVVSGYVQPNEWGVVKFSYTGGTLTIGSPSSGSGGSTIDDPYLTVLKNDGSPLTAFTGMYIASDDDSGGALGSLLSLNLLAGNYIAFVSHCCQAFPGSINVPSGIHSYIGESPALFWTVTFSENVIVERNAVPEPVSLALFGMGLAGLTATRRRKQG